MSLDDLTRNSFQSGVSAPKWLSLSKMFIADQSGFESPQATQRALSNSVLVLYRSFPGDAELQEYLRVALQEGGMLPVSVFVSTLLQAARSTELHAPATLDMLCRLALDAYYSSRLPSNALSYADNPMTLATTLQDALALIRVAHQLPLSHFHQLTTSASELVILLFKAADVTSVPSSQVVSLVEEGNSVLAHTPVSSEVQQVLAPMIGLLTLLTGEDIQTTSEPPLMHNLHLAPGKSDGLGATSNTDTVSFSLILSYLVIHRADDYGAGSGTDPAALFVSVFRWASWTAQVFYTQLFVSAFLCLSEGKSAPPTVWRAFIVGRLPFILSSFEKMLGSDGNNSENWRAALQVAVTTILRRSELLDRCDRLILDSASPFFDKSDDPILTRSIARELLRQLLMTGLVDQAFVSAMDPAFSNDSTIYLHSEAQDAGLDLDTWIGMKLALESDPGETRQWVLRLWNDSSTHKPFTDIVLMRFKEAAGSLDTEILGHFCRLFYQYDHVLDMVSLQAKMSELIFHALVCLEDCQCDSVGDPQVVIGHLGDVVLFIQVALARYHIETETFSQGNRTLSARFLKPTNLNRTGDLSEEEAETFQTWSKALFNSDGVEDSILRTAKPKTLLRIAPALLSHALKDATEDALNDGVSYFVGPLLRWTSVAVVFTLIQEVQHHNFAAPKHINVLQTLLTDDNFPRPILCLCSREILFLLSDKRAPDLFDRTRIQLKVGEACGPTASVHDLQPSGHLQPRQVVREAISKARAAKASALDIQRCIRACDCDKFLRILWSELLPPASHGETDVATRVATFALTMPRPSCSPPLLPLFLHRFVPGILPLIEREPAAEQTVAVELLSTILLSVLMASLHLHLAHPDARPLLGSASVSMLAGDLRARAKRQNNTSKLILQRLSQSPSLVANFPVFKAAE